MKNANADDLLPLPMFMAIVEEAWAVPQSPLRYEDADTLVTQDHDRKIDNENVF
jgi:hypothetical protein